MSLTYPSTIKASIKITEEVEKLQTSFNRKVETNEIRAIVNTHLPNVTEFGKEILSVVAGVGPKSMEYDGKNVVFIDAEQKILIVKDSKDENTLYHIIGLPMIVCSRSKAE
jgi:2-polyprenyl-3-methyl-5-hydroxy-6-metoxy-1,4-benzoquinol methylase